MLHSNLKKAQGLQINTIIIIALGLIVLIILIVMVQQRTNLFSTGLRNVSEGGMCAPENEIKPIGTDCDVIYGSFKDVGAGQICCRRA